MLYSICQRYNFESNLQHFGFCLLLLLRCIRYVKDTILKAIYNIGKQTQYPTTLYSICQRYNFESNLQLIAVNALILYCCIRYVKDTILKAIYNVLFSHYINLSLYSICQRYNFESNLQLYKARRQICNRCIRYVKDTILKAIYNLIVLYLYTVRAVFDMSKIQF